MQVAEGVRQGRLVLDEDEMEFFIEVPPGDPNREYGKLLHRALEAGFEPLPRDPEQGQPEMRPEYMRVHLVQWTEGP